MKKWFIKLKNEAVTWLTIMGVFGLTMLLTVIIFGVISAPLLFLYPQYQIFAGVYLVMIIQVFTAYKGIVNKDKGAQACIDHLQKKINFIRLIEGANAKYTADILDNVKDELKQFAN